MSLNRVLVLICATSLLSLCWACGDEELPTYDESAPCETTASAVGALGCEGAAQAEKSMKVTCSAYQRYACQLTHYWQCLASCYTCKDNGGVKQLDASGCTKCKQLPTCN